MPVAPMVPFRASSQARRLAVPLGGPQACSMTAASRPPAAAWWTPASRAKAVAELSAVTARRSPEHDTRSLGCLIWLGAPALLLLGAVGLWRYKRGLLSWSRWRSPASARRNVAW